MSPEELGDLDAPFAPDLAAAIKSSSGLHTQSNGREPHDGSFDLSFITNGESNRPEDDAVSMVRDWAHALLCPESREAGISFCSGCRCEPVRVAITHIGEDGT